MSTRDAERNRAFSRAQSMAKTELASRHADEYGQLYDFYCEHLGLRLKAERKIRINRPVAPPYQP